MIRVAVLTISDSCAQGKRQDVSGQTIKDMLVSPRVFLSKTRAGGSRRKASCGLPEDKFEICEERTIPDNHETIANELKYLSDKAGVDMVLTSGGTGLGPRDVTPEATASVCERIVPGLSEILRAEGFSRSRNAVLSRGVAGIRGNTLIINLPGSPKAVRECLEIILDILPHAVEMMRGGGH